MDRCALWKGNLRESASVCDSKRKEKLNEIHCTSSPWVVTPPYTPPPLARDPPASSWPPAGSSLSLICMREAPEKRNPSVSVRTAEWTILHSPDETCSVQNRCLLLDSKRERSAAMSIVLSRRELIYSDRLSLASFLSDWCTRLNRVSNIDRPSECRCDPICSFLPH